jgi:hypothetical protein
LKVVWAALVAMGCTGSDSFEDTSSTEDTTSTDDTSRSDTGTPTSVEDTTSTDDTSRSDTGTPASATLLLVLDNSDSMVTSAMSLAVGLDDVVAALPAGTLVAMTTVDVDARAGELIGAPTNDAAVLATQLLCEATCFRAGWVVASDPTHVCGDALGDEVTSEWLDCACGAGAWRENCPAAVEEGLEAIWLATCRADAAAPPACFDNGLLAAADAGSLELGEVHAVVISDEGDGSRRLDREEDASLYVDLLASSSVDVTVSAVVPGLVAGALACPGLATDWGVKRYLDAVTQTGGFSANVFDGSCRPADAAAAVVSVLP